LSKQPKDLFLGFSQFVMNHPFRLASVESMKAAARAAGARLVVTDAEGRTEMEMRNIELLLARGVDALIVSSLSGPSIYQSYDDVLSSGVPLIVFASGCPVEPTTTKCTSYVGSDEEWMGARAASYMGERLAGTGGSVVVLHGPPQSTNARMRGGAFESEMRRTYSNVEIACRLMGDFSRRSAEEVLAESLSTNRRFDAVFAENDEMGLGAVDALRRASREADVFVVGIDGQHEALKQIWQGGPFAMTIRPEWKADAAVSVAIKAALGQDVPARVKLGAEVIDRANVARFLRNSAYR